MQRTSPFMKGSDMNGGLDDSKTWPEQTDLQSSSIQCWKSSLSSRGEGSWARSERMGSIGCPPLEPLGWGLGVANHRNN